MTLPQDMNPGIRRTVTWLNANGFETCDSGDGETHTYGCDRDYPYVVMKVKPDKMLTEARRLRLLVRNVGLQVQPIGSGLRATIQASFDPADETAIIELCNVADWNLPES